jgi:uncharacterized protein YpuA (DUF1002 family)
VIIVSRLSTCKECGKKITSDEKKVHNSKTLCKECFKKISIESEQYKELITELHKMVFEAQQQFNPLIYKQIKEYKENYGFTHLGMLYTLKYIKNFLNKPIDFENYGIALVQYEYINAQKWWNRQMEINNSIKNMCTNIITINTFDRVKVNVQTTNLDTLLQLRSG